MLVTLKVTPGYNLVRVASWSSEHSARAKDTTTNTAGKTPRREDTLIVVHYYGL